jgi:hypothetical protein
VSPESPPQNKLQNGVLFSGSTKQCPDVHVYHAIHHNFTTFFHDPKRQNRQKPLQKDASTIRNFFRPLKSEKTGCMMAVADDFVPS